MPLALIEKEGIELSFGIAPRIPLSRRSGTIYSDTLDS